MRIITSLLALTLGTATLALSGCAFYTNGSKQAVVIRSMPEGAEVKVNGTRIGVAPVKVALKREDLFKIDVEKAGFAPQSELIIPSSETYERRFLRWGIDYDLGATKELVPNEISFKLLPAEVEDSTKDKYLQMVGQINRADAMLSTGQLDAATHRYLVGQIIQTYQK